MALDFSLRIIQNEIVLLEPLNDSQLDAICEAMIPDPLGWYSVMFGLNTREAFFEEIKNSEKYLDAEIGMGFLIRDKKTKQIAGMSFYLKMDSENRHLEIGSTNIASRFRRTVVNTATKLAMLAEAFEKMNCVRVSFRVDEDNLISEKAIERIGAVYGGYLRNERILPDGRVRNYKFYSIVDSEWPLVKKRLQQLVSRR
ncbi:MAG: GNAT family N-acetyltransferase [Bdellovibrionaceae bacterium]|nr:GNAT family N-acetyltransferase [Pseudobdellovibrionaceae bacterium]